ncbi:AP-5 complex subunit beta-1 [Tachyglossus aculeatus]|uniref:AP-5 complex subunit beta-1 n=1 Tax=Tachyglossus aculeatus TaxID=9261 RepID=UPI0018F5E049|nr:AP-5 complex subunit beta-1 [Tachyglossus aculeatus]
MAPGSGESWAQQLAAFRTSPAAFLAGPKGENLAANLLRDLRSDKLSDQTKASLLALTLEYPAQLWPDRPSAEQAAAALLDALPLLPARASALRRPLLMAVTTVLVAGDALGPGSGASGRLLALLLRLAAGSLEQGALRTTACECLWELESCRPGLLAGQLGLLRALQTQANARLLQALSLLYALALRNKLRALARAACDWLPEDAEARPGPCDWMLAGSEGERRQISARAADWSESPATRDWLPEDARNAPRRSDWTLAGSKGERWQISAQAADWSGSPAARDWLPEDARNAPRRSDWTLAESEGERRQISAQAADWSGSPAARDWLPQDARAGPRRSDWTLAGSEGERRQISARAADWSGSPAARDWLPQDARNGPRRSDWTLAGSEGERRQISAQAADWSGSSAACDWLPQDAEALPGRCDWTPVGGVSDTAPLRPEDAKELRVALAQLLDASYLLTAPAQGVLLGLLSHVVGVVRGQPPALFKPQLVRLLGTAHPCLLHAVLGLKAAFGEALFTGQDEALLLRRLVAAAQHPSLPPPARLFHLHCLLHFPENRPLGPTGEEGTPVLLTPRLAAGLFPSLLQEPPALLARLGLLCLLCLEEPGDREDGQRTLGYLRGLLAGLRRAAAHPRGPRATATLCFRATCLVARCFSARPALLEELSGGLARLYRARPSLAPHFVDLLDQAGEALAGPLGARLQREAVEGPGGPGALPWHLQILARVAGGHPPGPTLAFLRGAAGPGGGWAREQALLRVGRALLRAGAGGIGSGLADLLQELARSLGDPDGRDRARLYYSLLTHLGGPKLGAALGPSPCAPALCSSLAAESAGFAAALTVQEEGRAPLRLSRAEAGDPGPEASRLLLRMEALEPLYALELRFRVLEPHLEPLPAVHVPHLRPGAPSPPLHLALRPRRPYPACLAVSALYATPAGLTCHAVLPPLHVAFADLFLTFALPAPAEARASLFDQLWASCLPEGAESRVWWPVGPAELEGFVAEHLGPFVVVASPPSSFLVAIRLPPASRLLLRVEGAGRTGARVALRTDDWGLLPHAGEYLRGLVVAA